MRFQSFCLFLCLTFSAEASLRVTNEVTTPADSEIRIEVDRLSENSEITVPGPPETPEEESEISTPTPPNDQILVTTHGEREETGASDTQEINGPSIPEESTLDPTPEIRIIDDNDPRFTSTTSVPTTTHRLGWAWIQSSLGGTLRNASRTLEDKVHTNILKTRTMLMEQAEHFVGKLNTFGRQIYQGVKEGKFDLPKYSKLYIWNGIVKIIPAMDPNVPPAQMHSHPDIGKLPKYGPACIKADKEFLASEVSRGPKSDGMGAADFEPCLTRKRGEKQLKLVTISGSEQSTLAEQRNQENSGEEENSQSDHPYTNESGRVRHRQKRSETYSSIAMLWKDPTRIIFKFNDSFMPEYRPNVRAAINIWETSTCLRFIETNASRINEPYIFFTMAGQTCSTNRLGPNPYPPYSTVIDASLCYNSTGSLAHEIGHAMGLSHSQKRIDRDQNIKVYMENIASSWMGQFDKDPMQHFADWGVPYYYDSIMHYFPYAASKNGLMTICPNDPLMEMIMGQREEPAFGDISLMNRIYCQESCYQRSELKTLQFKGNKSITISGRLCQNWSQQFPHKHTYQNIGNHNWCRNPDNWQGGPWCFTTDPTVKYEPCFSSCEDLAFRRRPACHGWCYNGGYHNPRTCECICSRYTKGNFCEEIDLNTLHAHITCGGKLSLKSNQKIAISSPNYPNNYTANTVCMWWIQAPSSLRIKLTIFDFAMEIADTTGCYDYLELRPSICASAIEQPEHMRFCGTSLKPTNETKMKELISDDNNFIVKFYSDDGETSRGFSLMAEVIMKPTQK